MTIEASVDILEKINVLKSTTWNHKTMKKNMNKNRNKTRTLSNHANVFVVHDALVISWIVACYAAMWTPSPLLFFVLIGNKNITNLTLSEGGQLMNSVNSVSAFMSKVHTLYSLLIQFIKTF